MEEYYDVTVKMTFNVPDINGGVITSTFYSLGQLCESLSSLTYEFSFG